MFAVKSCIILVVLCFITKIGTEDIGDVIERVPENERLGFVQYNLKLGYVLSQKANHDAVKKTEYVPTSFAERLYEFAVNNRLVNVRTSRGRRGPVVCFPNGQCIDMGDIGVHP